MIASVVIQGILIGVVVTGIGFCVTSIMKLGDRLTRVEIIQRLQLKHLGIAENDIELELTNHKTGGTHG